MRMDLGRTSSTLPTIKPRLEVEQGGIPASQGLSQDLLLPRRLGNLSSAYDSTASASKALGTTVEYLKWPRIS